MEETFAVEIARRLWEAGHTGEDVRLAGDDYSRMIAEAGVIIAELGFRSGTQITKAGVKEFVSAGVTYLATHCPTS